MSRHVGREVSWCLCNVVTGSKHCMSQHVISPCKKTKIRCCGRAPQDKSSKKGWTQSFINGFFCLIYSSVFLLAARSNSGAQTARKRMQFNWSEITYLMQPKCFYLFSQFWLVMPWKERSNPSSTVLSSVLVTQDTMIGGASILTVGLNSESWLFLAFLFCHLQRGQHKSIYHIFWSWFISLSPRGKSR